MLYSICQRYNFESNLQHICGILRKSYRCIRYVKDTILKAIYNIALFVPTMVWLYSICQRYNFESNLQLLESCIGQYECCIRYVKDTILKAIYNGICAIPSFSHAVFDMSKIQFWKQFTTLQKKMRIVLSLYSICQRYNFESNLQLLHIPCKID